MPVPMPLEPPLRVSPTIKFCRWSLLLAGIWWGQHRFRVLKKREDAEREYIAKMKPIWMEEKRRKIANKVRKEMIYMAGAIGTPIPADFDQKYPEYDLSKPVEIK